MTRVSLVETVQLQKERPQVTDLRVKHFTGPEEIRNYTDLLILIGTLTDGLWKTGKLVLRDREISNSLDEIMSSLTVGLPECPVGQLMIRVIMHPTGMETRKLMEKYIFSVALFSWHILHSKFYFDA